MKSNTRDNSATITVHDLINDINIQPPLDRIYGYSHAEYLECSIELLELALCNSDLTPFVNRPMLEKCVTRTRELRRYLVAEYISYDYVYHTLKQEFGIELGVKPHRRR